MEFNKELTKRNCNRSTISGRGKRIALIFLALGVILSAAYTPAPRNPETTFTVVLDAGHGGKDPGNLGTGRYKETEKDIALDVVHKLASYITESYPEVEIVYTRKDDSFPTLQKRVTIANESQADLFISVHLNANDNKAAYGSETFVMGLHKSEESLGTAMRENNAIFLEENHEKAYSGFDPKNPDTYIAISLRENVYLSQSLDIAKSVQDQFRTRVGRKDRGVKQAGFYVVSFTNMPSILVELGFLTNATEEDFLQGEDGKTYLASALFRAFRDYKEKTDLKNPTLVKPETAPLTEKPKESTIPNSNDVPPPAVITASTSDGIIYNDVPQGIKFQVQILTSVKPVDKKSEEFKGIKKVDEYLSNGVYKYLAGCTANYNEAKQIQQSLRNMGFRDAFIVAFENGKKIELSSAINKTALR